MTFHIQPSLDIVRVMMTTNVNVSLARTQFGPQIGWCGQVKRCPAIGCDKGVGSVAGVAPTFLHQTSTVLNLLLLATAAAGRFAAGIFARETAAKRRDSLLGFYSWLFRSSRDCSSVSAASRCNWIDDASRATPDGMPKTASESLSGSAISQAVGTITRRSARHHRPGLTQAGIGCLVPTQQRKEAAGRPRVRYKREGRISLGECRISQRTVRLADQQCATRCRGAPSVSTTSQPRTGWVPA
ncbi:hypothetical protein B0G80_1554 [Paraburkholderia sp. BL6669N2]|nr:hypothetical protein B0G80_1554 [Paraburkholderia sp. BL6669N2]